MSFSVIIPSKTAANLAPCVEALRRHEPTAAIIIVDDGVNWIEVADRNPVFGSTVLNGSSEQLLNIRIVSGLKPFVFARNCNLGILACEDDVVLLNDDAILDTPYGFHAIEDASQANPGFGLISAVTNLVGNQAQRPQHKGLREESRMVCFVCVYIPRRTLETVGLLDEEFVGYGFEDDSYCLRVRRAGLKIGIFDGCFVDHNALKSTFRHGVFPNDGFKQNQLIFREKYGAGNHEL